MTELKINENLKDKYPILIELIKNSLSMDNEERQYWFDLIPKMTDNQLIRLTEILQTEKDKLEELEKKYHEEIKTLNSNFFDEELDELNSFK